ncbi:MAG: SH3 domain-containing protein [Oscillospiraceae bacterium]|nr:SH3 domain-containing protein [Oscillospiraceae bacterium]
MDNNIPLLLQKAEAGDPAAQYELAKHYGRMIQDAETVEDTYSYSKQAMMWLKKSALQGYGPAKEALEELKKETLDFAPGSAAKPSGAAGESASRPAREGADTPSSFGSAAGSVTEEKPREPAPAVKNSSFSSADTASADAVIAPPVLPEMNPPLPDGFAGADMDEYDAETLPPAGPFSRGVGMIVTVLLIISLLANAVLGYLLWRSKKTEAQAPPSPPPQISDGIDLPLIDEPDPAENTGGEEDTEAMAPVDPVIDENEPPITEEVIDLAQLRRLDFIPAEIYGEFVYYTVQTDGYDLNIRKGPGTNYDAIGSIPTGTQIGVAADSGEWYLACYDGTYGWVSGSYLRKSS